MVQTIYLLRHAESIGNRRGYDVPDPDRLTDKGQKQAERVTETLSNLSIDKVVCSPLNRTRRTIRPYLQKQDEIAEIWAELREACWQQHDDREIESLRYGSKIVLPPEDRSHFVLTDHEYPSCHPPADETYAEGLERIRLAKSRVLEMVHCSDYDSLLIVGHGHTHLPRMCEFLLQVAPDGPQRFSFDNVGLTKLQREADSESRFRILYSNRTPR